MGFFKQAGYSRFTVRYAVSLFVLRLVISRQEQVDIGISESLFFQPFNMMQERGFEYPSTGFIFEVVGFVIVVQGCNRCTVGVMRILSKKQKR